MSQPKHPAASNPGYYDPITAHLTGDERWPSLARPQEVWRALFKQRPEIFALEGLGIGQIKIEYQAVWKAPHYEGEDRIYAYGRPKIVYTVSLQRKGQPPLRLAQAKTFAQPEMLFDVLFNGLDPVHYNMNGFAHLFDFKDYIHNTDATPLVAPSASI